MCGCQLPLLNVYLQPFSVVVDLVNSLHLEELTGSVVVQHRWTYGVVPQG